MYLTYAEYQAMGGTLTETVFSDYEFQAEALINYRTFNRLVNDTTIPVAVKKLIKCIIDLVYKKSLSLTLGNNGTSSSSIYVTQQSNDGVSTSYNGMASTDLFTLCNTEIQKFMSLYLQGVSNSAGHNLLFRGLYKGE